MQLEDLSITKLRESARSADLDKRGESLGLLLYVGGLRARDLTRALEDVRRGVHQGQPGAAGYAERLAFVLMQTSPPGGERMLMDVIKRDGGNPADADPLGWAWASRVLAEAYPETALPLLRKAVLEAAPPRARRAALRTAGGRKHSEGG